MTFFYTVLVMNGISGIILLILIVLKKYVAVYGESTIRINDEKELTLQGGESLLQSLFKNKIYVPSACGSKGTCGMCKIQILEGTNEALSIEEALLSYKEIKKGYRLSCQTKIRNDISITIPQELLDVKEYRGEIVTIENLTHDIKRFTISFIGEEKQIHFKSGQYIVIEMSPGETRAYSIASLKKEITSLKIEVKKIPDGLCSTYLHSLKEHDKLTLYGPYGDFNLQKTNNSIICIAGGVGLAPMKSIIDEVLHDYPGRHIDLYYGARTIEDLYDYKFFINLEKEYKDFSFYPALSDANVKDTDDEGYTFQTGFIHQIVEKYLIDGTDYEAYLCGPPIMIDAALRILLAKKVPADRILYDKF